MYTCTTMNAVEWLGFYFILFPGRLVFTDQKDLKLISFQTNIVFSGHALTCLATVKFPMKNKRHRKKYYLKVLDVWLLNKYMFLAFLCTRGSLLQHTNSYNAFNQKFALRNSFTNKAAISDVKQGNLRVGNSWMIRENVVCTFL